jgi:glycogen debranching enzyme
MIETVAFGNEPANLGTAWVTLVEGSSFCVCEPSGDISPGTPQGIFARDTRILSRWQLVVDGVPLQPLVVMPAEPFAATFLSRSRPRPERHESTLLIRRDRFVGEGMREDIVVENFGAEAAAIHLEVVVEADFADLFEVKEGRIGRSPTLATNFADGELRISRDYGTGEASRGVRVLCPDGLARANSFQLRAVVPPRGRWHTVFQVIPLVDGREVPPQYPVGRPVEETAPARLSRAWRESSPVVRTSNESLQRTLERSRQDLGALRILDPEQPDVAVVAAGAPWFMALFGRDSLLTSWMALPIDQHLALGTLKTLARYQGNKVEPLAEEEPGRILHEVRLGADAALALGGSSIYYGTADATPLFVMLLGELRRWGLARDEVDALLPHADRALEWVTRYGDRDGDLFIEYQRKTDRGLLNQGWKDSRDGVNFADGTLATSPIALCEVQGYVYGAFLARAHFAWEVGDDAARELWVQRAARLRKAFNERFWLPDRGWYAIALDREKRPVDALTSNIGHCLWTGIIDEDKAPLVAERLMSPEMFSGWGVRTLATSMGAYNPISYHNGSVWPHDNALVAAGLMRYGFVEEAQRVATAILDAADAFGGRLPELFCGFDRSDYPLPVPFPTSCSPQAWAAATPVQMLRTLLRFEPWVPHGKAWFAPALPSGFGPLGLDNIPLGGARISVDVINGSIKRIEGLPAELELITDPRPPLSGTHDGWQMGY